MTRVYQEHRVLKEQLVHRVKMVAMELRFNIKNLENFRFSIYSKKFYRAIKVIKEQLVDQVFLVYLVVLVLKVTKVILLFQL